MKKTVERISIGEVSPGTERHFTVHRYGTPGARPKAYIQAAIHADEIPAVMTAHHLIRQLDAAAARGAIRGEIIVVPVANPIGMAQHFHGLHPGRYELRGGGNFNRNWPDLSLGLADAVADKLGSDPMQNVAIIRAAMGEALGQATADGELARLRLALYRLAHDSDYLLDLHCDDDALLSLFLTEEVWPDGADLAAETGARVVMLNDERGSGTFNAQIHLAFRRLREQLGDRFPITPAVFASTIEYRGESDVTDGLGLADAAALLRFLQRRNLVAGNPGPLPPLLAHICPLDGCDYTQVKVGGLIAYRVALGDMVATGDVIADIIDPLAPDQSIARTAVHAATDGFILSLCQRKLVSPGDYIATVAGTTSLAHRATGNLLID